MSDAEASGSAPHILTTDKCYKDPGYVGYKANKDDRNDARDPKVGYLVAGSGLGH